MNILCLFCIFKSKVKIRHTSLCDTRDTIRDTALFLLVCVCVFKRPEHQKQFGFGSALTPDKKQTEEEKRGESEEEGEEGDRRKQQTEREGEKHRVTQSLTLTQTQGFKGQGLVTSHFCVMELWYFLLCYCVCASEYDEGHDTSSREI